MPGIFFPWLTIGLKASHDSIEKSLQGQWREDQLFLLKENYESYRFIQSRIVRCDEAIEAQLKRMAACQQDGEYVALEPKATQFGHSFFYAFKVNERII